MRSFVSVAAGIAVLSTQINALPQSVSSHLVKRQDWDPHAWKSCVVACRKQFPTQEQSWLEVNCEHDCDVANHYGEGLQWKKFSFYENCMRDRIQSMEWESANNYCKRYGDWAWIFEEEAEQLQHYVATRLALKKLTQPEQPEADK